MERPVSVAIDRSISVPPGAVIRTGYVPIDDIVMACRDRMAMGDVKDPYEKRLQLGDHQPWPCPRGYWRDDRFVIMDGRHEYVAALMLGYPYLLVAWVEERKE